MIFETATELARRIRQREVSVQEVMDAHLDQVQRTNPRVNAIVTLCADRAREAAKAADTELAHGAEPGPLFGLPIAHKDLVETAGIRTTYGSPIFSDFVPKTDALIVERLRAAGAIAIGKTNVPEFGAGSQTFNTVFGSTCNPYDLERTCGGSSGGAAVALACGMVPIADGSDMGGSLRNPASFCNVVGFRPSPGRVPSWPNRAPWSTLSVQGPMARTVADVALMLQAIAGPDPRSPIAIREPASRFARPLEREFRDVRIAWSRDLGGLPVDPRVTRAIDAQRDVFQTLGCRVEDASPDFSGADEAFRSWRAWLFALGYGPLLERERERIKDTVVWNVEQGLALKGTDLARAERLRARCYQQVREFMERYEFLVLPVSQVPPFDLNEPWVREIDGTRLEHYIDWMRSCYWVTVTGLPAISVPCGFTPEGLPVGVQIVGRHQEDLEVLRLAHAFESLTEQWRRRPAWVGN